MMEKQMTLAEFNAWFDGYSEAIGEAPTPEQWQRIKEKLATVTLLGPSTQPVYPPTYIYPTGPLGPPSLRGWEITCQNAAQ